MKNWLIIILIMIIVVQGIIFKKYKDNQMSDIKIPVLLYHDFVTVLPKSDDEDFNYINTPQSLEENIKTFLEAGYTFISMKELNDSIDRKDELPSKPILMTLDDGYYSNYEYVYPILKKYEIKASIFVITDNIGKEIEGKKYLGWDECSEMQESGLVAIYSHSKRHIFYDRFSVKTIRDDVKESYEVIEEKLGKKDLKVFAYPYGAYTKEAVFMLKMNGINMQLYDIGMNYLNKFDRNYIKRINIPCEMTGKEIIYEIQK